MTTYDDVVDAIKGLTPLELSRLKRELPDIIFYALQHELPPCQHAQTYQQRRGDRSVDTICAQCGCLVRYTEA